jgi:hypothetical protein
LKVQKNEKKYAAMEIHFVQYKFCIELPAGIFVDV